MRDWGNFTGDIRYNQLFPLAQTRLKNFASQEVPQWIKMILVFGSACTHFYTAYSDIDMLIITEDGDNISGVEIDQFISPISGEKDIIFRSDEQLHKAMEHGDELMADIMDNHVCVYSKDGYTFEELLNSIIIHYSEVRQNKTE